jgi:hypothetical protein
VVADLCSGLLFGKRSDCLRRSLALRSNHHGHFPPWPWLSGPPPPRAPQPAGQHRRECSLQSAGYLGDMYTLFCFSLAFTHHHTQLHCATPWLVSAAGSLFTRSPDGTGLAIVDPDTLQLGLTLVSGSACIWTNFGYFCVCTSALCLCVKFTHTGTTHS